VWYPLNLLHLMSNITVLLLWQNIYPSILVHSAIWDSLLTAFFVIVYQRSCRLVDVAKSITLHPCCDYLPCVYKDYTYVEAYTSYLHILYFFARVRHYIRYQNISLTPIYIFPDPRRVQQIGGVLGWNPLIWLTQGLIDLIITEKDIIWLKQLLLQQNYLMMKV